MMSIRSNVLLSKALRSTYKHYIKLNNCKFGLVAVRGLTGLNNNGCITEEYKMRLVGEKIVRCPLPDVVLPKTSFAELFFKELEKFNTNTLFIDGMTGQKLSYIDTLRRCCRVSSALIRRGLKPGDRVAFYSANHIDYFVAWLAAIAVGAIATNINPAFQHVELKRHIDLTEPVIIFAHPACAQVALQVAKLTPKINDVIVFGESEGCVPFSQLSSDDGTLFAGPHPTPHPESTLAFMPSSSGTTGLPKIVCHTHQALTGVAISVDDRLFSEIEPNDISLLILPFYHIFPIFKILADARKGASHVILPAFIPDKFLQCIQEYRVTNIPIVPPLGLFLLQHPMVAQYDLTTINKAAIGAAVVSKEMLLRFKEHFKIDDVRQGYGLTEGGVVTIPLTTESDLGSVGVPVHNALVKIVDTESGAQLGPNQNGELCYSGPSRMLGYLNNPQATKEAIDIEDWLHTGDIGYYTETGSIYIVDRMKDMVKYKGHQVAPAELEDLLLTHPKILDAAVIGIPDERAGEVCRAFVVLKDDIDDRNIADQITNYISQQCTAEKHLYGGVVVVDSIPKSPAGKILKKDLRNLKP